MPNIETHLDSVGGALISSSHTVADVQNAFFHQLPVADSDIELTVNNSFYYNT